MDPRVVAAPGDFERLTHQAYFEDTPMGVDEADAEVASNLGIGAAFDDQPQSVELELTRIAAAGEVHTTNED